MMSGATLPSKHFTRARDSRRRMEIKLDKILQTIIGGFFLSLIISRANGTVDNGDLWPLDRPNTMPSIQSLEVMCGKDHMDVHLSFSKPFEGIVSSKGQHGDPRCIYIPPSTGQTFFSFRIAYARCGTKPDLNGQFYENTVVVQYDKDLLEVWDEAKRLRCEWFNDYEKTASKPPMVIADLDVVQLDFRGDNVDCWMEIQHGKGPWAPPVSGIVPLGSTLTLVVAINDFRGEFDMRVKSCAASDGGSHIIHLSDEMGCVLRPKMLSRFLKLRATHERATVLTYAFFHAFKFPDALSVHIKCKVEICRHGCLEHCQSGGGGGAQDRNDQIEPEEVKPVQELDSNENNNEYTDEMYDDIVQHGDEMASISSGGNYPPAPPPKQPQALKKPSPEHAIPLQHDSQPLSYLDRFPHGPRNLDPSTVSMMGPRSFDGNSDNLQIQEPLSANTNSGEKLPPKRKRAVFERKARSADIGVTGLYEVISEADLAFSPDSKAEAVTVFQGRIREEVVYGICLPVPGFSALFVLVTLSAVISALVAGSLLYRYQMHQGRALRQVQTQTRMSTTEDSNANQTKHWIPLGILKICAPSIVDKKTNDQDG